MINAKVTLPVRGALKKALGFSFRFIPRIQRALDSGLTVFAFHDVSNEPSEFARKYGLVVSAATFERQVRWIQANFELIHPSTILENRPFPKRAAMISFDDGYRGTFDTGLPILERLGAPSIIFLNMHPILHGTALLSAVACFLDQSSLVFGAFCQRAGLQRPFHLSLTPRVFSAYQREYGLVDHDAVTKFQGAMADLEEVKRWDAKRHVCYGNHLFEHWNAAALTADEFEKQYMENEAALAGFSRKVNLFAFTNGRPQTCFTLRDVESLRAMGAGKAFSSAGGVNQDRGSFLQGRVALCETDSDDARLWFRVGRAVIQHQTIG